MNDSADRRYRYPFTHCDQCGPRYSIMTGLPYDRVRTSLNDFPLCPDCSREYHDPINRRFHAQSISCPQCGPQLRYRGGPAREIKDTAQALEAAIAVLAKGGIVAVRGVGGYHLMVDATNDAAVALLRLRKHRPEKPLAVMFPWQGEDGLDALRKAALVTDIDAQALCSPESPIVLLPLQTGHELGSAVAPGLNEIGALLPYAPLHHLILSSLNRPLIATSANISGDPIITDPKDAEQRLAAVADGFLHHDRQILHRIDDGIYRPIANRVRPIRLGRGATPWEIELPYAISRPILAVGAQQKNTISLAWAKRLVLSPHIGNLDSFATQTSFEHQIKTLQGLYDVQAEVIIHDQHAAYFSTRWAKASGLECRAVSHHHAHAAALCGEHGRFDTDTLVFTWDGTGLGEDGTLWGGEALIGRPGAWKRHASFETFALPGGESAIRAPWRLAQTLCWACGIDWQPAGISVDEIHLLHTVWERQLNSPTTSSVGRLFDAAAALLGLVDSVSHEAQAPMRLEATARGVGNPIELLDQCDADGVLRCDWRPLIRHLVNDRVPTAQRAADFHATLAQVVLTQARSARTSHLIESVGLTGGVFQNRRLTEETITALQADGFEVLLHERIPCNDGGISYGQVMETLPELRPVRRLQ
jgi:[NiFe] hydrogenase maturation protein HypF